MSLAIENFWGGPQSPQKADDMFQHVLQIFSSEFAIIGRLTV
jgi:hypothetical protein